jgi:H+/Cl- antiporter ClcA
MNLLLLTGVALALLAIGSGMVAWEFAALRPGRHLFRNRYTRQSYWLTYFCAFVLGAVLLLRAAIWWVEVLLSTQRLPDT